MLIYISIAVVVLVLFGVLINNQIIARKNRTAQAFGSIEIFLKKRFDLIPNLVATLNKYVAHEKETLLEITQLRAKADSATNQNEKIEASNQLSTALKGLNVTVENYPNLKADTQFTNLQYELTDIEDQISASRRSYNAAVTAYNNKIEMFPASIIAAIRKDKTQILLEIPQNEQKEVDVKSLLNG